MKTHIVTTFEISGCTVIADKGRAVLSAAQMQFFSGLSGGGRVCIADLIDGYRGLTPAQRVNARNTLLTHSSDVRAKIRPLGLDIVCIRGWGYRLGEVHAVNAKNTVEEPTHSEKQAFKALDVAVKPAALVAALSETDRMRIRNLSARGLSLTGIASMIRKPYAAIAAELRAAR